MNKRVVGFFLIIALALAAGMIFKNNQKTTLSFINNDTDEQLNGKIFLDGKYFADTNEGIIEIKDLQETPEIISLVGENEGLPYELQYPFNENYSQYSVYYLEAKSEEIEMGKRYYSHTRNDEFKDSKDNHWPHMPLTYGYENNCKADTDKEIVDKILVSLDYITKKTNGAVTFVKSKTNYSDITFSCHFNEELIVSLVGSNGEKAHASPSVYPKTNIYAGGIINLYEKDSCALEQNQVVIMHEVLHLLGLKHGTNSSASDIMAPTFSKNDCNKNISQKDIDYIKNIYLRDN